MLTSLHVRHTTLHVVATATTKGLLSHTALHTSLIYSWYLSTFCVSLSQVVLQAVFRLCQRANHDLKLDHSAALAHAKEAFLMRVLSLAGMCEILAETKRDLKILLSHMSDNVSTCYSIKGLSTFTFNHYELGLSMLPRAREGLLRSMTADPVSLETTSTPKLTHDFLVGVRSSFLNRIRVAKWTYGSRSSKVQEKL